MSEITILDRENWEAFFKAPVTVLMLAKTDCQHCADWTEELKGFLATDQAYAQVRFGKMYLNTPGLGGFKKQNPWIAEVDVLPFNVIFKDGQKVKSFPGGGLDRLKARLDSVLSGEG